MNIPFFIVLIGLTISCNMQSMKNSSRSNNEERILKIISDTNYSQKSQNDSVAFIELELKLLKGKINQHYKNAIPCSEDYIAFYKQYAYDFCRANISKLKKALVVTGNCTSLLDETSKAKTTFWPLINRVFIAGLEACSINWKDLYQEKKPIDYSAFRPAPKFKTDSFVKIWNSSDIVSGPVSKFDKDVEHFRDFSYTQLLLTIEAQYPHKKSCINTYLHYFNDNAYAYCEENEYGKNIGGGCAHIMGNYHLFYFNKQGVLSLKPSKEHSHIYLPRRVYIKAFKICEIDWKAIEE